MFELVNKYGNITVRVASESDRDRLIRSGYKPVIKDVAEMTVPELEKYAKEKGIDLSGCKDKKEKLARILGE